MRANQYPKILEIRNAYKKIGINRKAFFIEKCVAQSEYEP